MRTALLQLNSTFGDTKNYIKKIENTIHKLENSGVELCIASELSLCGYPISQDLFFIKDIAQQSEASLKTLSKILPHNFSLIIGSIEITTTGYYNAAFLIQKDYIQCISRKKYLNTLPLFDEQKVFCQGTGTSYFILNEEKYIISIGHDITLGKKFNQKHQAIQIEPSIFKNTDAKALICLSAEPFIIEKENILLHNLKAITQQTKIPTFFVNQVGGNEQLVFFGGSTALNKDSDLLVEQVMFQEHTVPVPNNAIAIDTQTSFDDPSLVWESIVLGIQDYIQKNNFVGTLVGLSGGMDSSLTATLAVEALGAENVYGILMPSPWSSDDSILDAQQLAANLNIKTMLIPIATLMEETKQNIYTNITQSKISSSTAEENIQARLRCLILMSLSNMFNWLVLTTGNKSELSVGYCTLYGDMGGGFAPIADLYKTEVYKLAYWYNSTKRKAYIPSNILTKEPSAELRPNQKDQDALPPYELLDSILHSLFKGIELPNNVNQNTIDYIKSLVKKNAFKRKQATPGIILTNTFL